MLRTSGGTPGCGRTLRREVGYTLLPGMVTRGLWLIASGLAATGDRERRRALHDRLADTWVVWQHEPEWTAGGVAPSSGG